MPGPEYAICSTTYNCAPRLAASLASLTAAFPDPGPEVVVVDNLSTDGTREALADLQAATPGMAVLDLRCKRGKGRQVAYQASKAAFVVRCDLDTIYSGKLAELVRRHAAWPHRHTTAVGTRYLDIWPRSLLDELGGWKDLNVGEDYDLWLRARASKRLVYVTDDLGTNWTAPDPERRQERRRLPAMRRHFVATRDQFRGDARLTLRRRLRTGWANSRSRPKFLALGAPAIVLAWATSLGSPKFRPADYGPEVPRFALADFGGPATGPPA